MYRINLDTPLGEYLDLCEAHGANADGTCAAIAWGREGFAPETPMRDALGALLGSAVGLESALFAFEFMLPNLSPGVRSRFARIIAQSPSRALHALNWRRLKAAVEPSMAEDWLLRSSWHSSWVRRTTLPNWEELP